MLNQGSYEAAFNLLCDDFKVLLGYVEPTETNLGVFSHRIYELLLRSCTEFESICKDLLLQVHEVKPDGQSDLIQSTKVVSRGQNTTLLHYKRLVAAYNFEKLKADFVWGSENRQIDPFAGWQSPKSGKSNNWYQAYNDVKHDRVNKFELANLSNLLNAMAGLFLLVAITECLGRLDVKTPVAPPKVSYLGVPFLLYAPGCGYQRIATEVRKLSGIPPNYG